jgi:hypothetical protein
MLRVKISLYISMGCEFNFVLGSPGGLWRLIGMHVRRYPSRVFYQIPHPYCIPRALSTTEPGFTGESIDTS